MNASTFLSTWAAEGRVAAQDDSWCAQRGGRGIDGAGGVSMPARGGRDRMMAAGDYNHRRSVLTAGIERDGFAIVPELLTTAEVDALKRAIADLAGTAPADSVRRRRGAAYAMRNLLELSPEVRALARGKSILSNARSVIGPTAFPVRATLFDETLDNNWPVAWHQDVTIAVRERREAPEFERWSVKAGVIHVQPPDAILEGMLAVRLHLDPCGADNGALRVIPGSHCSGRLEDDAHDEWVARGPIVCCSAPAGAGLLLRPLLLHASSPTQRPAHRRVIHIEYAATPLPGGLRWTGQPFA